MLRFSTCLICLVCLSSMQAPSADAQDPSEYRSPVAILQLKHLNPDPSQWQQEWDEMYARISSDEVALLAVGALPATEHDAMLEWFRDNLIINRPFNANMIGVSFKSPDAYWTNRAVDAIVRTVEAQQIERFKGSATIHEWMKTGKRPVIVWHYATQ